MTHRHEWRYAPVLNEVSKSMFKSPGFYCTHKGCKEFMYIDSAERRLNATEFLNADQAENAALHISNSATSYSRLVLYCKYLRGEQ